MTFFDHLLSQPEGIFAAISISLVVIIPILCLIYEKVYRQDIEAKHLQAEAKKVEIEAERQQAEIQAEIRSRLMVEKTQLQLAGYANDIFEDISNNILIGVITGDKALKYAKYKITNRAAVQSLAAIVKLIENLSKARASAKNDPENQGLKRLVLKTHSDAIAEIHLLLKNLTNKQANISLEEANKIVQRMLRELTTR
jgi:hypothetical protein